MKKAEQEAIRRARMEVVRAMRRGEEGGVAAVEGVFGEGSRGIESEDDDEEEDEED
jgi:hypothetical protein